MADFGRYRRISDTKFEKTPRGLIQPDIGPSERLLWADKPLSRMRHAQSLMPKALLGVPFLGFALFWTYSASGLLRQGPFPPEDWIDLFFPMFGIPFILVGAGMLLSPVWAAVRARWMIYAVTNKRLIIKQTFPLNKVRSWQISQIDTLDRRGPAEGIGDLIFAEEVRVNHLRGESIKKIGFWGIEDPKRLEDEIRKLQSEAA